MREKKRFYSGVLTGVAFLLSVISGTYALQSVDLVTLGMFCVKSFLVGACVGVMLKVGVRRATGSKKVEKGWKVVEVPTYEYFPDPNSLWFVVGFGIVVAAASALLVTSLLAFTTLFVFSFGFMLVYSGAISEIMHPWTFVEYLSVAIITIVVTIVGIAIVAALMYSVS